MGSDISSLMRIYHSDTQASDNEMLNGFVDFLSSKSATSKDVKLAPVVATDIKTGEVFFSPDFRAYFTEKNLDEGRLKDFFLGRHVTHVQQFKDLSTASTKGFEDSTMLSVISSAHLERKEAPHEIPGELYHRDGRGNALSVKITLATQRVWEHGQLNVVKPKADEDAASTIAGKNHDAIVPDAAPRLESPGDAFLLNNKELYHAVVTPYMPFDSEVESGRRTIYQERLNRSEGFDRKFLEPFTS
jgi:hypothetical protein